MADISNQGFMLFCEVPVEADSVLQLRLTLARPLDGIESISLCADCLWSCEGSDAAPIS